MKASAKVFGAIALLAIALLLPLTAAGKDVCAGTYDSSSFGSIIVPEGETCKLHSFNVVSGNIDVKEGATLIICPDNEVGGNIKAHGAGKVFISDQKILDCAEGPPKALGIAIGGNIDVKNAGSFSLIGNPAGVTSVDGNVKVQNTQSVSITDFDGIGGNVLAYGNSDVSVTGNTIGGNLEIKKTSGTCVEAANTVGGRTDTCP